MLHHPPSNIHSLHSEERRLALVVDEVDIATDGEEVSQELDVGV